MIIRLLDRSGAPPLDCSAPAPEGMRGGFGRVDVLQFTSAELAEAFGIRLAPLDVMTPFELAAALEGPGGASSAIRIRKDLLVRLIEQRRHLLPCFVGHQWVDGAGFLPFMTDGPSGKWSLFFEKDGRMALVERVGDRLVVTEPETVRPVTAEPGPARRPFILAELASVTRRWRQRTA